MTVVLYVLAAIGALTALGLLRLLWVWAWLRLERRGIKRQLAGKP